jgi:hypothetical protein
MNFCLWLKWGSSIERSKKKMFIILGKYSQKYGYKENYEIIIINHLSVFLAIH